MNVLENNLMKNCDKETRIYCRSFNHLQEYLEQLLERDSDTLSDWDLSSLGLYLCKCVEQEVNSSVVQVIRKYLGIQMPEFYCRVDQECSRDDSSVYTGGGHKVYFNEPRDKVNADRLRTVPLGDVYHALETLLREDFRWFSQYPVLKDYKFRETIRSLFPLRNSIAHSGSVINRKRLVECYDYCRTFFVVFMPKLAAIKQQLAPDDWEEQDLVIEVEPAIIPPPKPKITGVEAILANIPATGKPKANAENYAYWESLHNRARQALQDDPDASNELYDLLGAFERQFDWFEYPFEDRGKFGIKDIRGCVVIPAKYDGFLYLQSMVFPSPKVSPVRLDNKYGLVERYTGKELSAFIYDSMWRMQFHKHFYYQEDGSKCVGILSDHGEELVPCIMDKVDELTVGVIYESGDRYGYLALDYGFCLPPIYDEIKVVDLNIPFVFVLNGVEGCISNKGQFYSKEYLEKMEEDDSLEYVEKWDLLMVPEG